MNLRQIILSPPLQGIQILPPRYIHERVIDDEARIRPDYAVWLANVLGNVFRDSESARRALGKLSSVEQIQEWNGGAYMPPRFHPAPPQLL